jgi:hypothetical protein
LQWKEGDKNNKEYKSKFIQSFSSMKNGIEDDKCIWKARIDYRSNYN